MDALQPIVANLERQRALYGDLDEVLREQRAALVKRDVGALEAANRRHALLADLLATLESERQGLLRPPAGQPCRLGDLVALAGDPDLCERARNLQEVLPGLIEGVMQLTRANRVLAADAGASTAHLLGLLGIEEPTDYAPPARQSPRGGPCLRLDVTA